jgi:conjugative transposon TraM protein
MNSADIDRLERMMSTTRNGDGSEDPEMEQLNGMMDKIIDIQHPERVKKKLKQSAEVNKEQVYTVTSINNNDKISLLTKGNANSGNATSSEDYSANGFYSLEDDMMNNNEQPNAIRAVIHETQTVVEGAIVKLRLVNDLSVNGTLVTKGSFLFGTAALSGERLNIKINSIRYKNSLFPVQLSVMDMDGLDGVYVPGAITRDMVGNSTERAVQGIGITALNPSLGAQAAGAGIEAAKTLLGKKAKLIKVTLKAGYQVLLRDDKQKESY